MDAEDHFNGMDLSQQIQRAGIHYKDSAAGHAKWKQFLEIIIKIGSEAMVGWSWKQVARQHGVLR